MAKTAGDYRIPFTRQGDLLTYPTGRPVWAANRVFTDAFAYDGMGRGRSAVTMYWKSLSTGLRHGMFLTDLDDVLRTTMVLHGVVGGTWTFIKRGKNYGMRLVEAQAGKGTP